MSGAAPPKRLATVVSATLFAATIGACVAPAENTSSGTAPTIDASSGPAEAAAPDAASITPRPDLCEGLSLGTNTIPEVELRQDPPAPLGGSVAAGTYDLAELYVYAKPDSADAPDGSDVGVGSRPTGQAARITLIVSEFAMRTVEARGTSNGGLAPQRSHAALFRVDGVSLVSTAVCPTTALPVAVPFSAVGNALALFTDSKHREVYVRR